MLVWGSVAVDGGGAVAERHETTCTRPRNKE